MIKDLHTEKQPGVFQLFKVYAQERPLRLAADLAYFVHCAEGATGRARPQLAVTTTYQTLVRMVQASGLKSDDLLIMYVTLQRLYARIAVAAPHEAVAAYHAETNAEQKLLHAAYVSQAVLYDDPLAKKAWELHSKQTFVSFVRSAMDFCAAIDYCFYFNNLELAQAYTELVRVLEPEAIACYKSLGAPAKPAVAAPVRASAADHGVPVSPSVRADATCVVPDVSNESPIVPMSIPSRHVSPELLRDKLTHASNKRRRTWA